MPMVTSLTFLVQTRRNTKAAKRSLAKLIAQFGQPRMVITDKLRSYRLTIISYRHVRADAFSLWADYNPEMPA